MLIIWPHQVLENRKSHMSHNSNILWFNERYFLSYWPCSQTKTLYNDSSDEIATFINTYTFCLLTDLKDQYLKITSFHIGSSDLCDYILRSMAYLCDVIDDVPEVGDVLESSRQVYDWLCKKLKNQNPSFSVLIFDKIKKSNYCKLKKIRWK